MPPQSRSVDSVVPQRRQWPAAAIQGALWATLSVFPLTALMALCFRFPVPFDGIGNGVAHVLPALFGLLIYGVFMGGFVVVAMCGALAGLLAQAIGRSDRGRRSLQIALPIITTFALLFILATLDWYIGPW